MNGAQLAQQWGRFSRSVTIPSRDEGMVRFRPYGTQRWLVREIFRALEAGKREILVLKPRQVGASTVLMVFTLFWLLRHKGLQGALVTESDRTKEYLRGTFGALATALPAKWSYPISANNRYGVQWAHGSRLVYETAGLRKNAGLGKGRGLSYLHATEVSAWGDPEGVDSLRAALSERHPFACYLWESTAQGFNFFWNMFQEFSRAVTLEAIFIPWWRHELYTKAAGTPEYETYWDGALDSDERAWQAQIDRRWGVTLTPEQWAWYRWKREEKAGSAVYMHQNFPTLPEHAFQASGGGFVDDHLVYRYRDALRSAPAPTCYRYDFRGTIEESGVHPTDPHLADLLVWEPPRVGAHYVVSADPSYGAGGKGDSDLAACTVWRCGRARLTQAASFVSRDLPVHQFAWVCMHLAGSYFRSPGQSYFILEMNGPGRVTFQEIQRLMQYGYGSARPSELIDVLGGIQHYIYRRPDSLRGGGGFYQWLTTQQTKKLIVEQLRDALLSDKLLIRDAALVDEIAGLRRQGDDVSAEGGQSDDRAITCAMAIQAWHEMVLPYLLMLPDDPQDPQGIPDRLEADQPKANVMVREFFERLRVGE